MADRWQPPPPSRDGPYDRYQGRSGDRQYDGYDDRQQQRGQRRPRDDHDSGNSYRPARGRGGRGGGRRDGGDRWQHDRHQDQGDRGYPRNRDDGRRPRGEPDYASYNASQEGYDSGLIRFAGPSVPTEELPDRPTRHESNQTYHAQEDDGRQRRRTRPATAPNNSVIFIGLPQMTTDDDLRSFVDEFRASPTDPSPVENVTIVIDKQTGISKRFAFVRFISLEHARAFVEANFDHVLWRSRGSHDITEDGCKVRIDYASNDRKPGEADPRARGREAPYADERPLQPAMPVNDGSGDIGSTPNRILLLRYLDPLTQASSICNRFENLNEATREAVKKGQGPRRAVLIKDKLTSTSWCFAFLIYPNEDAAKATMRTILDPSVFPTGFTIDDRLVAVTFARFGSLSIAYAKTTWSFTDEDASGGRQELIYCDDAAYGAIYDSAAFTRAQKVIQEESAKASDVDAFFSELEKEHPPEKVTAPPAFTLTGKVPLHDQGIIAKGKKKPELIVSKKSAVDINKWNQKKAEIDEVAVPAPTDVTPTFTELSGPVAGTKRKTSPNVTEADNDQHDALVDFGDLTDPEKPKCLLCQRQFKEVKQLQRHTEQSALHKTNLADETKVATARAEIAKLSAGLDGAAEPAYRDRALERRTAYNQPENAPPQPKKHKKIGESAAPPVVSAPIKEIDESNIGSKLLAGMGWAAGAGLGADGAGRTAPIQVKAFAAGAGIGAATGADAHEQAGAAWGTSELGRSKARQRMNEER